jgi:serine/threonine protein kinase/Tol biopolymer transport system component
MTVTSGSRLGPYEIVSPLGAGGMGEVYRAHDTKLGRDVALKILPEGFVDDPERVARFRREAQVLASLNHPHIAAIYGLEEATGSQILILELVEGETLAQRLKAGPLPLDEALTVARQIADALEAAHEKGIIHRDLKPANIAFTASGQVKVLDFGLAKALEPLIGSAPNLTNSPTLSTPAMMTGVGVILGTAAYMSPEQARGKTVDKRADIWALGCVLFEMLAGKPAFSGETLTDIVAAVVKNEPDWRLLRVDTPAGVRSLLRRCLSKGPEQRVHDVADARIELNEILAGPTGDAVAVRAEHRARTGWGERAAWVAAVAVLSMALLFALRPAPVPASGDVIRLSILPPEKTSFTVQKAVTVGVPQFDLSPDGHTIVFAAAMPGEIPSLWLRSLDSVTAHSLPGTEGAENPFWSPDNRWIGFFADEKLKKIAVTGGPSQLLASVPDYRSASWGLDDTILFSRGTTGLLRVRSSGGTVTPVSDLDVSRQEGSHRFPAVLPDGSHFLFQVRSLPDYTGVYAGSLDGKTKKKLVIHDLTTARYSSGYLYFPDGDTLMAQPFDVDRLELRGQAFAVGERIGRSSIGTASFSVSRNGTLAYARTLSTPSRLTWFDRTGNPTASVSSVGDYTDFRLSPDETRLAASLANPKTGFPDIWLTDLTRGSTAPFTFGPGINASGMWSPDGGRIIFRSSGGSSWMTEFHAKSAGGGGEEQPVLTQEMARASNLSGNVTLSDWSSDGRHLLFSHSTSSGYDLFIIPLTEAPKPVMFLSAPGDQVHGNFSPDGRLVAYSSSESGRFEIHVQTFPLSDRQWIVSTEGGYEPRWRADGRELYYLSLDQKIMAVSVGPGRSFGVPKALFQTAVPAGVNSQRTHYVPSRDGQRFLISTLAAEQAPTMSITVVLNATAALRK